MHKIMLHELQNVTCPPHSLIGSNPITRNIVFGCLFPELSFYNMLFVFFNVIIDLWKHTVCFVAAHHFGKQGENLFSANTGFVRTPFCQNGVENFFWANTGFAGQFFWQLLKGNLHCANILLL